jgi:hypothetical protein
MWKVRGSCIIGKVYAARYAGPRGSDMPFLNSGAGFNYWDAHK